jgi:hypothetical protein
VDVGVAAVNKTAPLGVVLRDIIDLRVKVGSLRTDLDRLHDVAKTAQGSTYLLVEMDAKLTEIRRTYEKLARRWFDLTGEHIVTPTRIY